MSEVLERPLPKTATPNSATGEDTQKSPGTVYESGRRRREEILDAATTLFGEHAYNGVSMRDIATATGVTHAGLRYHFPSKDELLIAVLERYSDQGDTYYERALEHVHTTPPDFWGVLSEFTAYLRHTLCQRLRAQMFIMHAVLAADTSHPAHTFFERRYELIRTQFTEIIGLLQQQGYMRPDFEAVTAATEIVAMVDGLQLQWMISPKLVQYRPIVEESVRRLLLEEHRTKFDQVIAGLDMPGGQ